MITSDQGPSLGLEPRTYALRKHGSIDESAEKRREKLCSANLVAPMVALQSRDTHRDPVIALEPDATRQSAKLDVAATSFVDRVDAVLRLPLSDNEKADLLRLLLCEVRG